MLENVNCFVTSQLVPDDVAFNGSDDQIHQDLLEYARLPREREDDGKYHGWRQRFMGHATAVS